MSQFRIHSALLFALCLSCCAGVRPTPDHNCFKTFFSNPRAFDVCKTKLCFLYLTEPPFVFRGEVDRAKETIPFSCNKFTRSKFGLKGLFFDMLDEMELMEDPSTRNMKNAMCVFGGDGCSFDGSLKFMQDSLGNNTNHLFIAGGYFVFLPHRRTSFTIQSAPTLTTDMVLLYNRERSLDSFWHAKYSIFRPFENGAWIMVATFGVVLCICFLLYFAAFCPANCRNPLAAIEWFLIGKSSERVFEATTWRILRVSVVTFFTVLILIYEVGIAAFIFRGGKFLIEDMEQIEYGIDLKQLAVPRKGASETILRRFLSKKYEDPDKIIWHRTDSLPEMVRMLQNGTVRYLFHFDRFVMSVIHSKSLCDKVTVAPLGKQTIGGWYFGSNIHKSITDVIDKSLMNLHLDRFTTLGAKKYGNLPADCGTEPQNIDLKVMLLLLLCTVGPLLFIYFVFFGASLFVNYMEKRRLPRTNSRINNNSERSSRTDVDYEREIERERSAFWNNQSIGSRLTS